MTKLSPSVRKCKQCGKPCVKEEGRSHLTCSECHRVFHSTKECTQLDENLLEVVKTYKWQCATCKRCELCKGNEDEKNLILCDACDRGYHRHCLHPPLTSLPKGEWKCQTCSKLRSRSTIKTENVPSSSSSSSDKRRPVLKRKRRHSSDQPPSPGGRPPRKAPTFISARKSPALKWHSYGNSALKKKLNGIRQRSSSISVPTLTAATTNAGRSGTAARRCSYTSEDFLHVDDVKETCAVPGCDGKGNLCDKYTTHNFKEACLKYHRLSIDDSKIISAKRRNLLLANEAGPASPQHMNKKQEKSVAELVEKRTAFEESMLRKISHNMLDSVLKSVGVPAELEPSLFEFAIEEDRALFRMAQASAAEDLQQNRSLRNRMSSRIKCIRFGRFEIETINPSCYPDDVAQLEKLYICEFCLKYLKSLTQLASHTRKCSMVHPPGSLIYKKKTVYAWKVDGSKNKVFCQNLCLLAKLFLDHKTLYYDVEPFNFYILTENTAGVHHITGYFSKEKESMMNCNLSCILVLPPYQCKGYGKALIELSYILSKLDDKIGSPEHPLSDLGLISYRGYWKEKIFEYLVELEDKNFSVRDLSQKTGIHVNDIVSTLQYYGLVKYWRGEYWIVRSPELKKVRPIPSSSKKNSTFKRIDVSCLKLKAILQQSSNEDSKLTNCEYASSD